MAIISREAARRYWGGASPIGSLIDVVGDHGDRASLQIVGVVEDVKATDLTEPMPPRIYRPFAQRPQRAVSFAVRSNGDPAQVGPAVRDAMRLADRDLAVSGIQPLATQLFDTFRENRVLLGMFVAFALVALLRRVPASMESPRMPSASAHRKSVFGWLSAQPRATC